MRDEMAEEYRLGFEAGEVDPMKWERMGALR